MKPPPDPWQAAVARHSAGDLPAAIEGYRALLKDTPDHPGAWHLLGVALAQSGAPEAGLAAILEARSRDPANPDLLCHLGNVLLMLGRREEALAAYREVLMHHPTHADAQLNLAVALLDSGAATAALRCLRQAVASRPDHAPTLSALAEALLATGSPDAAVEQARRAVALAPDLPEAALALANGLRGLRRFEAASRALMGGLARRPDHPGLRGNLGYLRLVQGHYQAAADCFRSLLGHDESAPGLALAERVRALAGLGNALAALGELDPAADCYRRARALAPMDQGLAWNESLITLTRGDLAAGWAGFDARLTDRAFDNRPELRGRPRWRGEPVAGETILLSAEQGLGDTIQFIRYAPLVQARGARVIVEVQPALLRLLAPLDGCGQVIAQGTAIPPFDRYCPLLSLPRAFGTTLATIPAAPSYLTADTVTIARWRARLMALAGERLRVGLVWAGNPHLWDDHLRSPGLAVLAPILAVTGVHLFGLQLGPGRRDLATTVLPSWFTDLGPDIADFADTAAIMDTLDLVISSCTAPAHLAGALGRPLWLLLAFAPDWRWFRNRSDSPWYPTARLFRQPRPGAWPEVAAEVARALAARAAECPAKGNSSSPPDLII